MPDTSMLDTAWSTPCSRPRPENSHWPRSGLNEVVLQVRVPGTDALDLPRYCYYRCEDQKWIATGSAEWRHFRRTARPDSVLMAQIISWRALPAASSPCVQSGSRRRLER